MKKRVSEAEPKLICKRACLRPKKKPPKIHASVCHENENPRNFKKKNKGSKIVIIGAGPAGLSCAVALYELAAGNNLCIEVEIIEARARVGGRICSTSLNDGTIVDTGAAYIHGTDLTNPVYLLAKKLSVNISTLHGGYSRCWGSSCPWYDSASPGVRLPTKDVRKVFDFAYLVNDAVRVLAHHELDDRKTLQAAIDYVCDALENGFADVQGLKRIKVSLPLSPLERNIYESAKVLFYSYCEAPSQLGLRAFRDYPLEPSLKSSLVISPDYETNIANPTNSNAACSASGFEEQKVKEQTFPVREAVSNIRCMCDRDVDAGVMLFCEKCQMWQHAVCIGLSLVDELPFEEPYFCERCEPHHFLHVRRMIQRQLVPVAEQPSDLRPQVLSRTTRGERVRAKRVQYDSHCSNQNRPRDSSANNSAAAEVSKRSHLSSTLKGDRRVRDKRNSDSSEEVGLLAVLQSAREQQYLDKGQGSGVDALCLDGYQWLTDWLQSRLPEGVIKLGLRVEAVTQPFTGPAASAASLATSNNHGSPSNACSLQPADPPFPLQVTCAPSSTDSHAFSAISPEHPNLRTRDASSTVFSKRKADLTNRERDHTPCLETNPEPSSYTVQADAVVCTVPLGVLQASLTQHPTHAASTPHAGSGSAGLHGIRFSPPLSAAKCEAIQALGMGCEAKVILRYARAFWPCDRLHAYIQSTDSRFRFINLACKALAGKTGVIVALTSPPFAREFSHLSDAQIVEEASVCLRNMFLPRSDASVSHDTSFHQADAKSSVTSLPGAVNSHKQAFKRQRGKGRRACHADSSTESCDSKSSVPPLAPVLLESLVTRWEGDPFARGSYSCMGPGACKRHVLDLARPEYGGSLLFAGEACASSDDGAQCVHGAVISGCAAAEKIVTKILMRQIEMESDSLSSTGCVADNKK